MMLSPRAGRIGPNAIIQVVAAPDSELGAGEADALLSMAGLGAYRGSPPQTMVDEQEVIALHAPVQRLLRMLRAAVSSRVLLRAIGRHSWTFAGSGHFAAHAGRTVIITIADCSLCRGAAVCRFQIDWRRR